MVHGAPCMYMPFRLRAMLRRAKYLKSILAFRSFCDVFVIQADFDLQTHRVWVFSVRNYRVELTLCQIFFSLSTFSHFFVYADLLPFELATCQFSTAT